MNQILFLIKFNLIIFSTLLGKEQSLKDIQVQNVPAKMQIKEHVIIVPQMRSVERVALCDCKQIASGFFRIYVFPVAPA